jgi:hypothetical protein
MRELNLVTVLLLSLFTSSCVLVGDAPVTGRSRDVTMADIRAAMAVDPYREYRPSEIHVVSRDEIHLFHGRNDWTIIKRIKGKWRYWTEQLLID